MAIHSQLSIAKKRLNGYLQTPVISLAKKRKNGYLQSTGISQNTLKWLSTVRVVINCLKIRELYMYKVVFLFIMLKGWYFMPS